MPAKLNATAALVMVLVVAMMDRPVSAQAPPPSPPTTAEPAPTVDVSSGWRRDSAVYDLSHADVSGAPGTTTDGGTGVGHAKRVAAPVPISFPYAYFDVDTLPNGWVKCWRLRHGSTPDATVARIKMDVHAIMANLVLAYPRCPVPVPIPGGGAVDTTPAVQAVQFLREQGEDLLPKPSPHIAPGWMLTGKMAYLEAGSPPTAHFEHPTSFGTLTIDATSELFVDWGKGGWGLEGPRTGPGGPWPNGNITHFWTTVGHYDIKVVQRWSATWSLGTATGTLDGLETQGTIDNFEVRQLQAVRNS